MQVKVSNIEGSIGNGNFKHNLERFRNIVVVGGGDGCCLQSPPTALTDGGSDLVSQIKVPVSVCGETLEAATAQPQAKKRKLSGKNKRQKMKILSVDGNR